MFRQLSLAAIASILVVGNAAPTPAMVYLPDDVNYTFENLTPGTDLVGQDNWLNYTGTSAALQVLGSGTGYNQTQVVQGSGGQTIVAIRPNDGAYSFPENTGGKAIMQFDFRWDSTAAGGQTQYYVGLGADSPAEVGDTVVSTLSERAPAFGVRDNRFFIFQLAGGPTVSWTSPTIGNLGGTSGDWLRVKLEVDANADFGGGSLGAGNVYFRNLTQKTGFTKLTGTPVELHLDQMESDIQDPAAWNTMVVARSQDTKTTQIDNVVPNLSPYVYTFENIDDGTLVGNDNWQKYKTLGGGLQVATRDSTSFSDYPTKTVNLSGAGGDQLAIRPNDDAYRFPTLRSTDTGAILQFDVKYSSGGGAHTYYLGLGADSDDDGDGVVSSLDERAPAIGVINNQFVIRELADGGNSFSEVFARAITAAEAEAGDWIRLRHVMDFTDNWNSTTGGYDGSGQLYYQNLTRGDDHFIPLTSGGVNLRITDMLADIRDPSTWDTMVLVRSGSATDVHLTNIFITNVPEPSALVLLGFGLLATVCRRRRSARF